MSAAGGAVRGVLSDPPAVNVWGLVVLGASLLTVALILLYFRIRKWQSSRGRMNSVAAGQLRLAATRDRVSDLELLATLPGFQVDADLCGWTALLAAAAQGNAGGWEPCPRCALVARPASQPVDCECSTSSSPRAPSASLAQAAAATAACILQRYGQPPTRRPVLPLRPAAATVWLLHHGADITKMKQDGWQDTALHYAAGSGSVDCIQALLAWGADPMAANALGGCRRCRLARSCWACLFFGTLHSLHMGRPLPAATH
jgi:hypothetical protein